MLEKTADVLGEVVPGSLTATVSINLCRFLVLCRFPLETRNQQELLRQGKGKGSRNTQPSGDGFYFAQIYFVFICSAK